MAEIETPCENICVVDVPTGLCHGCGRSLAEIEHWLAYSVGQRRHIIAELPARLRAIEAAQAGPG